MTTTEIAPPKVQERLPKPIRELQRKLKTGLRFEKSGSQHYRIRDTKRDRLVEVKGRPFSISSNPSGSVLGIAENDLREAQVLKGTQQRQTPEADRARREGLKTMVAERDRQRQIDAKLLRDRAAKVLANLMTPQVHADLGYAGAVIAREQGKPNMTPDLLAGSARRLLNGAWIEPRYQEVWHALLDRLEAASDTVGEWYVLVRESRGLDVDRVHVRTPSKAEWPFEVKLLPLEALVVDEYQRPVGWEFVRREAARFDPSLVGTIDVAQRSPGSFAVLDGQQRVEIVRLVGKGSIWASVYVGLDRASEARFFLHKNRDRKTVHPFHLYRALLIAEDPEIVAIQALLDEFGYRPSIGAPRDDRPDNVSAISALESAYRRKLKDDSTVLRSTLTVLRATAYGRPMGSSGVLIRGLSRMLEETGEPDLAKVESVVLNIGPELLVMRARDASRHNGGSAELAMARILTNEYRRHRNGKGRQ